MLFQSKTGVLFYIGDTVEPVHLSQIDRYRDAVEALVDADREYSYPHDYLEEIFPINTIITSSPKKYEERKWANQYNSAQYLMDNWSWREILATALVFSFHKLWLYQLIQLWLVSFYAATNLRYRNSMIQYRLSGTTQEVA